MKNDYFAKKLLDKLASAEPIFAAYEAQQISREIGFDFDSYAAVLPRALDEVREAEEALTETGPLAREHYGDELADIMFSLINLYRHAGLTAQSMDTLEHLTNNTEKFEGSKDSEILSEIRDLIAESTENTANEMYENAMKIVVSLATSNGYNTDVILRDNVRKYLDRCAAIEKLAEKDNKNWSDLSRNNEIITYWKEAKKLLH